MDQGRPPLYKTPEELNEKIEEFFNQEKGTMTISGLCLYLGFASRQSFYDMEQREGFSYTIKRARLAIEAYYESMLMSKASTGAIFALKNFGWKDKSEIDHNTNINIEPKQFVRAGPK